MKRIFLSILILLISLNMAVAQAPTACDTPFTCSINLKLTLFTDVTVIYNVPYFKNPLPTTCTDVKYLEDEYQGSSCPAPSATLCENDTTALHYDVYYPTYHNFLGEGGCALPVVIFFHAGAFKECSGKDKDISVTLCMEFAKRGFVAISVEYRRGKKDDNSTYRSVQNQLAQYRACQDARGAIRSIIKRQQNESYWNDPYRISLSSLFVAGASAGGVPANLAAWYTDDMVFEASPSPTGSPNIKDVLGSINADYYYADSTVDYHSKIKALLVMWSGLSLPTGYNASGYDFFTGSGRSNYLTPVIAFHGKLDDVFHFDEDNSQNIKFSPDNNDHTKYNKEDTCIDNRHGPYGVDKMGSSPDLVQASSLNMYDIATHFSKATELYVDCQMHHGLDKDCDTCNFQSEFGTGLTTINDVVKYIVQRATIFFSGSKK